RAERVSAAADGGVVAGDDVVAGAAIDAVGAVRAAGDVVAADQVVVTRAAGDRIVTLLTENNVRAVAGDDRVVAAAVGHAGVGPGEHEGMRRELEREERGVDVPIYRAVVAEGEVVTGAQVDEVGPGAAEDDVVARAGRDQVGVAECGVGGGDQVDVDGVVV